MPIALDKKGFPKVMKLGVAVPTKSGNPFHDAFSGKFAFAPPGVNIIVGKQIVKDLSSGNRKILFEAAKKTKANQLGVSIKDGKITFNLFRDGRLLTRFAVADDSEKGTGTPKDDSIPSDGLSAPTGAWRDAVVDAARETKLEGDSLKKFLEERLGIELDDRTLERLSQLVDEQRINDLSDYINVWLKGDKLSNKIRLAVPRGFVRKAFANLEVPVIQEVFRRLKLRGWSDEIINEKIVSGFSKERRREITGKNQQPESDKIKKEKKDVAGRTN